MLSTVPESAHSKLELFTLRHVSEPELVEDLITLPSGNASVKYA
jgi:hypothetical protein